MKKPQKLKDVMIIPLQEEEIKTGLDRLTHAENLIRQLKFNQRARNQWLILYGRSKEADNLRKLHKKLKNS